MARKPDLRRKLMDNKFNYGDKLEKTLTALDLAVTNTTQDLEKMNKGSKEYISTQNKLEDLERKRVKKQREYNNIQGELNEAHGANLDQIKLINDKAMKMQDGLDVVANAFGQDGEDFAAAIEDYADVIEVAATAGKDITDAQSATLDEVGTMLDNIGKVGTEDFKGFDAQATAKARQGLEDKNATGDDLAAFDMTAKAAQAADRTNELIGDTVDKTMQFGKGISDTLGKIPLVGGTLSKTMNKELKAIGGELRKNLVKQIKAGNISVKGMGRAFRATLPAIRAMGASLMTATGGITLILGLLAAAAVALVGLATKARDFAKEQGVAFSQSVKLQGSIMKANIQLIGTGQDASAIAGEMIDTFGRLDGINANNIKNIGRLATRFGASTKDIIGFQKAFGDLTGASADQANDVVRAVGQMATGAGVAAGKVIADISSNMESFAKFSTMGAEGLAQAAVEAAKVGGSLSVTMKAAESLLNFESSLTAEYEAQVLTGKTLNLERARQLALEGDIGKLTTEISKQIGSVGDIGKMNAIAKQSLADAIGIQVSDLMKISRGEAAEVGETQEDLQRKTNDILTAGFQGNKDELAKLNNKPGNGDSGMYDEFSTL